MNINVKHLFPRAALSTTTPTPSISPPRTTLSGDKGIGFFALSPGIPCHVFDISQTPSRKFSDLFRRNAYTFLLFLAPLDPIRTKAQVSTTAAKLFPTSMRQCDILKCHSRNDSGEELGADRTD